MVFQESISYTFEKRYSMLEYLEILYIFFFFFLPGATRTNDAKELMYARQKIDRMYKIFSLCVF
jgi:hypothetical protein